MLQWTQRGNGARVMMLVHHDDAVREFAYGAESKIGTFNDALMERGEERRSGKKYWNLNEDWSDDHDSSVSIPRVQ